MITYRDLLILKLSHLTEWKNETEMYVPNCMMEYYDSFSSTCEFLENGRYILRGYYEDGSKHYKDEFKYDERDGKYIEWYENGNKHYEMTFRDGKLNGKRFMWRESGYNELCEEHKDGKLIRTIL